MCNITYTYQRFTNTANKSLPAGDINTLREKTDGFISICFLLLKFGGKNENQSKQAIMLITCFTLQSYSC